MGEGNGLSQDEWVILLLTGIIVMVQGDGFYWGNWLGKGADKTWAAVRFGSDSKVNILPMFLFPSIWMIVNGFAWASWFMFFRNKESMGNRFDMIMGFIVVTLLLVKAHGIAMRWGAVHTRLMTSGFFLMASAVTTWGLMWAYLPNANRAPNPKSYVTWFWFPMVVWSVVLFIQGTHIWNAIIPDKFLIGWEKARTGNDIPRSD